MSLCGWCREKPVDGRQLYCGRKCRQAAFRTRKRYGRVEGAAGGPLVFAYADPPYVGLSAKYYRREKTFAGEVDHEALIARLCARHAAGELAGWALSCSVASLRQLLPLCPPTCFVAGWGKLPNVVPAATTGKHNRWEAVIVVPGRTLRPGVSDWLSAAPAKLGGSTLPGRKPIAFSTWLFRLLGMLPGDTLEDLFPGSGAVSRAWSAAGGVAVAARADAPQVFAGPERQLALLLASG